MHWPGSSSCPRRWQSGGSHGRAVSSQGRRAPGQRALAPGASLAEAEVQGISSPWAASWWAAL
eukprot:833707-Alexandrium_andersonii.AAC.1